MIMKITVLCICSHSNDLDSHFDGSMSMNFGENDYQQAQYPNMYASADDSLAAPQSSRPIRATRNKSNALATLGKTYTNFELLI